jgi:hypothetical protein
MKSMSSSTLDSIACDHRFRHPSGANGSFHAAPPGPAALGQQLLEALESSTLVGSSVPPVDLGIAPADRPAANHMLARGGIVVIGERAMGVRQARIVTQVEGNDGSGRLRLRGPEQSSRPAWRKRSASLLRPRACGSAVR